VYAKQVPHALIDCTYIMELGTWRLKRRYDQSMSTVAMINSGTQGSFLHPDFALKHRMTLQPLNQPSGIGNIDGMSNCTGAITHFVVLNVIIDGHVTPTTFLVTGIGRIDVILGTDWLWLYSPALDWKSSSISFPLCTGCKGQSDASGTGNNSEASLKSSEECPEHVEEEVEELPILCINANQCTCQSWKAKGLVTDTTDELWIAAGFT
jgi:hypothetical protein